MKHYQNIILISGSGKNVGKTTFACKLIKQLSLDHPPVAIKISPHFHQLNDGLEIIEKNDNYVIVKETLITQKDSSLMLQAGATQAFFIQCKRENTFEAFLRLYQQLNIGDPIVVESGELARFVIPSIRFIIYSEDGKKFIPKSDTTKLISLNTSQISTFKYNLVEFSTGTFCMKDYDTL